MKKQKRLFYIKKVVPVLYSVIAGLICLFITLRIRRFLNLLLPIETGYILVLFLVCYLFLMHKISLNYFVAQNRSMTFFAGISVFVILYLFMTIILLDLIRLFLQLTVPSINREQLFLFFGIVCILLVTCITLYSMYKVHKIKTKQLSLPCKTIPEDYHLVLLSDLHIGYYIGVPFIQKMVNQINALNPDLVVISGDLINAGNTMECPEIHEVAQLLSSIHSKEGVYAVTGNHDPDAKNLDFQKFLKDAHIHLLEDSVYTNEYFHLAGRNTRIKKRADLKYLLRGLSKDKPVFVLDHDPIGIDEAVSLHTHCILCGHTHKGQVFPLNFFVRFLYKKEEVYGYSKRDQTNIIVTSGTGYFSMPMRLGSDCEMTHITLHN